MSFKVDRPYDLINKVYLQPLLIWAIRYCKQRNGRTLIDMEQDKT